MQPFPPSPITGTSVPHGRRSQRKLFPIATGGNDEFKEREVISEDERQKRDGKPRHQLQMPSRTGTHRRSRSDMLDSICIGNKWVEYEKRMEMETGSRAPIAEPESVCNLSTLHLESQGKFISNRDILAVQTDSDVCNIETGPVLSLPDNRERKTEKKSSVGGFFSKLGRAVLKPRNVYSEGDQFNLQFRKSMRESKKSSSSDKENVNIEQMTGFERGNIRDSKRVKAEGNTNKVSRFFQRGGLYRSSKMKKKNQNTAAS